MKYTAFDPETWLIKPILRRPYKAKRRLPKENFLSSHLHPEKVDIYDTLKMAQAMTSRGIDIEFEYYEYDGEGLLKEMECHLCSAYIKVNMMDALKGEGLRCSNCGHTFTP